MPDPIRRSIPSPDDPKYFLFPRYPSSDSSSCAGEYSGLRRWRPIVIAFAFEIFSSAPYRLFSESFFTPSLNFGFPLLILHREFRAVFPLFDLVILHMRFSSHSVYPPSHAFLHTAQ